MKKYFEDCQTIEEVKATYKKLVFQYHPDVTKTDTTEIMATINNQYEEVAKRLKNIHKNTNNEVYEKETTDTSEEFRDIINRIIHFKGVSLEVCGSWIWVSGNTKEYKDILKELKFKWSQNKQAWYFHSEPYHKKSKKLNTLEEIREMFGSKKVKTKDKEENKTLLSTKV